VRNEGEDRMRHPQGISGIEGLEGIAV
jgi:hypothetical protein